MITPDPEKTAQIDAASAKPLAEIQRLKGHQLVLQQAMGFASGQTPSSLYAQGRY